MINSTNGDGKYGIDIHSTQNVSGKIPRHLTAELEAPQKNYQTMSLAKMIKKKAMINIEHP
jgi:hypothetical protein